MQNLSYHTLLSARTNVWGTEQSLQSALTDWLDLLTKYQMQHLVQDPVRSTIAQALPDVITLFDVFTALWLSSHEDVTRLYNASESHTHEAIYVETGSADHAQQVPWSVHRDAEYVWMKVTKWWAIYKRTLSNDLDRLLA